MAFNRILEVSTVALFALNPLIAFLLCTYPEWIGVIYLKDFFVFVLLASTAIGLFSSKPLYFLLGGLLPLTLYLAVGLVVSNATFSARLAGVRQMLYPFVFLAFGYGASVRGYTVNQFNQLVERLVISITLIGFVLFLLPDSWFAFTQVYAEMKGGIMHRTGVPSQWVEPIMGDIPRMVSVVFDPINLGHMLVFGLFYLYFTTSLSRWKIGVMAIALLLTFCKGAILQAIILLWIFVPNRFIALRFRVFMLLLLPVIVYIGTFFHPGIKMHQMGLENALISLSVFGYGGGKTGNIAAMFGTHFHPQIFDTYLGAVIGQIGVIGTAGWLYAWWYFLRKVLKQNSYLFWIIIAQLIVSVYSENAFNLLSIVLPMMALGLHLNPNNQKSHEFLSHN
ncbi:MAG TPA: hypothetical protein VFV37_02865 [Luteibaculaceae bacterium]|nr:hypothetical protein [Luteibaculaceae bacterium]